MPRMALLEWTRQVETARASSRCSRWIRRARALRTLRVSATRSWSRRISCRPRRIQLSWRNSLKILTRRENRYRIWTPSVWILRPTVVSWTIQPNLDSRRSQVDWPMSAPFEKLLERTSIKSKAAIPNKKQLHKICWNLQVSVWIPICKTVSFRVKPMEVLGSSLQTWLAYRAFHLAKCSMHLTIVVSCQVSLAKASTSLSQVSTTSRTRSATRGVTCIRPTKARSVKLQKQELKPMATYQALQNPK